MSDRSPFVPALIVLGCVSACSDPPQTPVDGQTSTSGTTSASDTDLPSTGEGTQADDTADSTSSTSSTFPSASYGPARPDV